MNFNDLDELTSAWTHHTNRANSFADDELKKAQDHAYALGLKRGLNMSNLTNDEILAIADQFGAFQYGDAQGHVRIEFANKIIDAAYAKAFNLNNQE